MKLYRYKNIDLGFVVLSVDGNPQALRQTVNSIRRRYDGKVVAATVGHTPSFDLEAMNKICPVYEGEGTITSLINSGMNKASSDWNMIVVAGICIRQNLDRRYSLFIESDKDVCYAIVNGYYEFPDCSLNGITIHKNAWKDIGEFCPDSPLSVCKTMWALKAIKKGCRFKGISGARII